MRMVAKLPDCALVRARQTDCPHKRKLTERKGSRKCLETEPTKKVSMKGFELARMNGNIERAKEMNPRKGNSRNVRNTHTWPLVSLYDKLLPRWVLLDGSFLAFLLSEIQVWAIPSKGTLWQLDQLSTNVILKQHCALHVTITFSYHLDNPTRINTITNFH